MLVIYEINHIWTAEMKCKWRNDRRSECNLCNCVKKTEKKIRTSTVFEPVTSSFTGPMLYQLSYEATDVGSRSFVGSYVPVKEMSVNDLVHISLTLVSYIINTYFFHGNIWTHNWPAPKVSGFIAQLVEHRTGKSRGHGFKPRWSPEFFSGFFTQLHKLRSLRRSFLHFHIFCMS